MKKLTLILLVSTLSYSMVTNAQVQSREWQEDKSYKGMSDIPEEYHSYIEVREFMDSISILYPDITLLDTS